MTSWTDKTGRRLTVLRRDPVNPARLVITGLPREDGYADTAAFWLDDADLLTDIPVEMFKASGRPAPVITPGPDIDTSQPSHLGAFRLSAEGGKVRVAVPGTLHRDLEPHGARLLAGWLVAYADAAESEPDPADVSWLARLIVDELHEAGAAVLPGLPHAAGAARRLLRSGKVTLTGEGDGRG